MPPVTAADKFIEKLKSNCPSLLSAVPENELKWFVENLPPAQQKDLYRVGEAAQILGRNVSTLSRWASKFGGVYAPRHDEYDRLVMHRKQIDLIAAVKLGSLSKSEADELWAMFLSNQGKADVIELPRNTRRRKHA